MTQASDATKAAAPTKKEPSWLIQVIGKVNWIKLIIQFVPAIVMMVITWNVGKGTYQWMFTMTDWVGYFIRFGKAGDPTDLALRMNGGIIAVVCVCTSVYLIAAGTLQAENKFVSILFRLVSGFVIVPWIIIMWDYKANGLLLNVQQSVLMMEIGYFIIFFWLLAGNMVINLALSKTIRTE